MRIFLKYAHICVSKIVRYARSKMVVKVVFNSYINTIYEYNHYFTI